MKVIMGSAVKGLALKTAIKAHLEKQGHQVIDIGCFNSENFIKYTSIGERVAKALQDGIAQLAINCCGSGTGASMSAGKFKGVLACSCESVATAKMIRSVNGANCLCLGESIVSPRLGCKMADAFLNARFKDGDVPQFIKEFWDEANREMISRGEIAKERELETL